MPEELLLLKQFERLSPIKQHKTRGVGKFYVEGLYLIRRMPDSATTDRRMLRDLNVRGKLIYEG